jgi:hypothetical protein
LAADCYPDKDANAKRDHDRGEWALFSFVGDTAQRSGSVSGRIFAESRRSVAEGVCTIAEPIGPIGQSRCDGFA